MRDNYAAVNSIITAAYTLNIGAAAVFAEQDESVTSAHLMSSKISTNNYNFFSLKYLYFANICVRNAVLVSRGINLCILGTRTYS